MIAIFFILVFISRKYDVDQADLGAAVVTWFFFVVHIYSFLSWQNIVLNDSASVWAEIAASTTHAVRSVGYLGHAEMMA